MRVNDTSPGRAAVILAGGASSRFGSDKTRALLDGRTLLDRVVDTVAPLVDELVVVGPWAPAGARHVLEPDRFQGPLAALAFGLDNVTTADPESACLVLGGDHPLVQPGLLVELVERLDAATPDGVQAVVPVSADRPQPLVACYRPSVAASADRVLASGQRSLRALLDVIRVDWMTEPQWRALDPQGLSFMDVDSPADLARLGLAHVDLAQPERPDKSSEPER